MKTIYLLFVVITNSQGYESMHNLDGIRYKSKDLCLVEKAKYVEVKGKVELFCGDEKLYFNKEQKKFY